MHRKEDESTNENPMVNGHVTNSTKGQVETETQTVLSSPLKRKLYSTNLMYYIHRMVRMGVSSLCQSNYSPYIS